MQAAFRVRSSPHPIIALPFFPAAPLPRRASATRPALCPVTLITSAPCGGRRPSSPYAQWQLRTSHSASSSGSRCLTTGASAPLPQRSASRHAPLSVPSLWPPSLSISGGSATCAMPSSLVGGLAMQHRRALCSSYSRCCPIGGGQWPRASRYIGRSVSPPKSSTPHPLPSGPPTAWCAPSCMSAALAKRCHPPCRLPPCPRVVPHGSLWSLGIDGGGCVPRCRPPIAVH